MINRHRQHLFDSAFFGKSLVSYNRLMVVYYWKEVFLTDWVNQLLVQEGCRNVFWFYRLADLLRARILTFLLLSWPFSSSTLIWQSPCILGPYVFCFWLQLRYGEVSKNKKKLSNFSCFWNTAVLQAKYFENFVSYRNTRNYENLKTRNR